MTMPIRTRTPWLTAAALALCLAAGPAFAAATDEPTPPATTTTKPDPKPADQKASGTKPDSKPQESKPAPDKKSQKEFLEGYKHAYNLIYKQQDYAGGIEALRALGHDDHADVANLIGFSSRKLGRYDDAKVWYEKALAADPKHTRTWQYYGMWYLEQGNRLKAEEHLEKIRYICGGTGCDDYKALDNALKGNGTY
jgi:tetratricopeptide (TPR) repeat protein